MKCCFHPRHLWPL